MTGSNAVIKVDAGDFELNDVKADQAALSVTNSGSVTMTKLDIGNRGSLTVESGTAAVTQDAAIVNSQVDVKSGTLNVVGKLTLDDSKLTVCEGVANLGTVTLKSDTVLALKKLDAAAESVTKS